MINEDIIIISKDYNIDEGFIFEILAYLKN